MQPQERSGGWVAVAAVAGMSVLLAASQAASIECTTRDTWYVRRCGPANAAECNDANDGLSPTTAWATLHRAAEHLNRVNANEGEVVIVGPGLPRALV